MNDDLTIIMGKPIMEKSTVVGRRWKRCLMEDSSVLRIN